MIKPLALASVFASTLFVTLPSPAQLIGDEEARVQSMLSRMTLTQKLKLVGGNGMYTYAIPEIGLHAIKMSDGPSGVRSWGSSTAYPVGIALAATWDAAMASRVGASLAEDAKARGVRILLAPGVNIYRTPMNGRNFEYFGEDPYLSSRMAVGYITGLQAHGVAGTVKHFDANNSEFDRHNTNAVIDERTLHEIYLPAFEAAVKEAHVSAVMDSYNLVNGQHATQNDALNNGILKRDWGFKGLLMSDWSATYDGVAAANGGLDLEMPKGKFMTPETLARALTDGSVSLATIDDHVRRILRVAVHYGLAEKDDVKSTGGPPDRPDARKLAYEEAAESIVLLKNNGNILPLDRNKIRNIALIGPNVTPGSLGGGGSSYTTAVTSTNLRDAMTSAISQDVRILYSPGTLTDNQICAQTEFENGLDQQVFAKPDFGGEATHTHVQVLNNLVPSFKIGGGGGSVQRSIRWTGNYIAAEAGVYLLMVTIHGRDSFHLFVDGKDVLRHESTEGAAPETVTLKLGPRQKIALQLDYQQYGTALNAGLGIILKSKIVLPEVTTLAATADVAVVDMGMNEFYESEAFDRPWDLLPGQEDLVETVLAANPNTIVVLNGGGGMNIAPWDDRAAALLHVWYGGEEGGHALADVINGVVNPSGKLPISFERRLEDNLSTKSYYPAAGAVDVHYAEHVFVGYRHFDISPDKPLFPFGFGLSYTSFRFSAMHLRNEGHGKVRVIFTVTNTGDRAGDEIAQVYVGEASPPLVRPLKELKGFERIHLAKGESRMVDLVLTERAFSYWDISTHDWKRNAGKFNIYAGDSSVSLPLEQMVVLHP